MTIAKKRILIAEFFAWQDRKREFAEQSRARLGADDEKLSTVGKHRKKPKYDGQRWNGVMA